MKKLNSQGFKISSVDKKAFEHYLLESPKIWATKALDGMINKVVKTIIRDWFEIYKSKQTESVSADISIIIPAIIAMDEFKPYKIMTPSIPIISRKEARDEEIWENGFDIEDYEEAALKAYYNDPEDMLYYFMENKIYARRKAFIKEKESILLNDQAVTEIPSKQDDFINFVCNKPDYKNRATLEAEYIAV